MSVAIPQLHLYDFLLEHIGMASGMVTFVTEVTKGSPVAVVTFVTVLTKVNTDFLVTMITFATRVMSWWSCTLRTILILLTLALNEGKWPPSHRSHFRKNSLYPLNRGVSGPQSCSGFLKKKKKASCTCRESNLKLSSS